MKITTSTKFRTFGGASALAITAGMAATGFAQTAPAPVDTLPSPVAPDAPTNVEECEFEAGVTGVPGEEDTDSTLVCAPGLDADGFAGSGEDEVQFDIQSGARVEGTVALGSQATGSVAGAVVTDGESEVALSFGDELELTNDGFVQTTNDGAAGVLAGDTATITNNGTINTQGGEDTSGNFADGLAVGSDATIVNNGDIITGTFAASVFVGDGSTVENSVTGRIISGGFGGIGIFGSDDVDVTNDGLIQTLGDGALAIGLDSNGSVTNSGNIVTGGSGSVAVSLFDDAELTNSGLIETGGETVAVEAGSGFTVENSGTIRSVDGDTITLASGTITNSGTIESLESDSDGAAINFGAGIDDSTVMNMAGGIIEGAVAIDATDSDGSQTIANFGTITGREDDLGDTSAVLLGAGDDQFQQWDTGVVSGVIDGGDGETGEIDTLVFGNANAAGSTRDLSDFDDEDQFVGFEAFGVLSTEGSLELTGATDSDFDVLGGDIVLSGSVIGNTLNIDGDSNFTVAAGGVIDTTDNGDAIRTSAQTVTITNNGSITGGSDAIDAEGTENLTIINNGSIVSGDQGLDIGAPDGVVVTNSGTITSADTAVFFGDQGEITNLAGGEITGSIALENISDAESVVANFGTITGTGGTAAELGAGTDVFQQWDTGVVDGVVDGGTGFNVIDFGLPTETVEFDAELEDDLLVFGNANADGSSRDVGDFEDTDQFINFERFAVISTAGQFELTGVSGLAITSLGGDILLNADLSNTVTVEAGSFTVGADTELDTGANTAIEIGGDGVIINNDGAIVSEAFGIDGSDDVGLTVNNAGTITSSDSNAITLQSGTINNSGTIESLEGAGAAITFVADADFDMGEGTVPEMEEDLEDHDSAAPEVAGPEEDGTVMNMAGGLIVGDVAIDATASSGSQTVVNFGTITVRPLDTDSDDDGILLGDGDDEFQQWTGAIVNGAIDLQDGDDTFILEGTASSLNNVFGGDGDDTAILAGILDVDPQFFGFETFQLGSQLGGTLNDLEIDGDRTIDGDVVHVGEVILDLGVDTLTTTGSLTLTETGTLTIGTPLDRALLGQNVQVLAVGGDFEDEGATINIIDDDLLLDYTPNGELFVQVSGVNPFLDDPDENIRRFGNALGIAVDNGDLDDDTFEDLNDLDAEGGAAAIASAIPSLSDAIGREIFETSMLSSQLLDRHLDADGTGVWGQVAVRGAEQDAFSATVDGYESDQLVFTAGADFSLGNALTLGVIASYADIDIDDLSRLGGVTNTSEVESIRVGGYAAISFMDRGFINAEGAYLTGDVDQSRSGFFGGTSSNFDFDGYTARATLGYDLLADPDVALTPNVGIAAAEINFDDTTETGGFDFLVERGDARFAETRFGLDAAASLTETVSGFISGTYIYDLIDSVRSLRLTSDELGSFLVEQPIREQSRFEVGAGATVNLGDNFAIDVAYLGDFNEGYDGHSARASLRIGF